MKKMRDKRNNSKPKHFEKRPPRSRPVVNYSELHPSKVDTSESLLASFTHRTVRPRPGESNEALIKRFKVVVEKSGLLSEIKKREFFKSDGQKRREKALKSKKRIQKEASKKRRHD